MTVKLRSLLTALSVALCLLSLPGGPLPVLALVALVPFGVAIHGANPLQAMVLGYGFGLIGWMGATVGLTHALSSYVDLSPWESFVFLTLLCAYLAIPYGLFGYCYGTFQWMSRSRGSLKSAACLTLLLMLFPTPLPVTPAHALYSFPPAIQTLELGGEPLLLFLLCLFNWLIVESVLLLRIRKTPFTALAAGIAIIALTLIYGQIRMQTYRQGARMTSTHESVRVVALQPNIPLHGPGDREKGEVKLAEDALLTMSKQSLDQSGAELVVWPELPVDIDCTVGSGVIDRVTAFAVTNRTALLINCVQLLGNGAKHNTALLVSETGESARYVKQRLFPFVEYIPLEERITGLRALLPGAAHYEAGWESVVFSIKGQTRVIAAICYEILFSNLIATLVSDGGRILINQTNDAWFGRSRIPDFLIAASTFRAVEYRIPVIRVSNSGNTLAIEADGDIVLNSRTPPFTQTTSVFPVQVPIEAHSPPPRWAVYGLLLLLAWGLDLGHALTGRVVTRP